MKESASRFGGFGFSEGRGRRARLNAENPDLFSGECRDLLPIIDDTSLDELPRQLHQQMEELQRTPATLRPAVQLKQAIDDDVSAVLVCATVRDVQRNYYALTRRRMISCRKLFIVHERMPAHQQAYVLECLDMSCDYLVDCPAALLTTVAFLPQLIERLPWLDGMVEIIPGHGCRNTSAKGDKLLITPCGAPGGVEPRDYVVGDPAVSCICLREGDGGRWLLTDHDDAALVRPDEAPAPELLPRLLNHCVDISGHQLAPFLARNFDVPATWKIYPELVTRSLLIFRKNRCVTGSDMPQVPRAITWSDTLGLIY